MGNALDVFRKQKIAIEQLKANRSMREMIIVAEILGVDDLQRPALGRLTVIVDGGRSWRVDRGGGV